jgi:hypothetical protein
VRDILDRKKNFRETSHGMQGTGTMLYTKHKRLQDEIYMEWNWYN